RTVPRRRLLAAGRPEDHAGRRDHPAPQPLPHDLPLVPRPRRQVPPHHGGLRLHPPMAALTAMPVVSGAGTPFRRPAPRAIAASLRLVQGSLRDQVLASLEPASGRDRRRGGRRVAAAVAGVAAEPVPRLPSEAAMSLPCP